MGFDLQYLLFLQNLREASGGVFDEFFNALSKFAVDILPFLPYIIYWCVNKRLGYRFIATTWIGEVLNGVIKLTVCAYRPWIRSDQIVPAGDSKTAATGYSFPSGHTLAATMHYGNTAVWQWNKRRWISILCGVLILLTGVSRNFLGVHTPQDVAVGMTEGVVLIIIIGIIEKRVHGNDKVLDILTLVGILATVGVILYISFKPYPMDYVDGQLLVDPQKMMNDSFKACGGFLGFLTGAAGGVSQLGSTVSPRWTARIFSIIGECSASGRAFSSRVISYTFSCRYFGLPAVLGPSDCFGSSGIFGTSIFFL